MYALQRFDQIVRGMNVYDKDEILVGTVDDFYIGNGAMKTSHTDMETIVEAISEVLGEDKKLSPAFYLELYDKGFVSIKGLSLGLKLIIFPDQIEEVKADKVCLNVRQVNLVQT